jgi:hypothetical protein
MELELLKLFFPEELVAHFDITGSAIKQGKPTIWLSVNLLFFILLPSFLS